MIHSRARGRVALLALMLAALAVATALGTVGLSSLNGAPAIGADNLPSVVPPIGLACIGALVASRRPHNATGWLMLVIALAAGSLGVEAQYAQAALHGHRSLPGVAWALWLNSWTYTAVSPAGAVAMLLVLLPDGRLPSPRWRPFAAVVIIDAAVPAALGMFGPGPLIIGNSRAVGPRNPLGVDALGGVYQGGSGPLFTVLFGLGFLLLLVSAAAPFVRMRRAVADERQRVKWIAYAV
ncbi:MAG: hypothetical protein LC749_20135, partial [Actinobacteria bacterium]|nr:hypothetical protein [Actinomycetota bacterium]